MGLFDAYDADPTDVPATTVGIPEGTHEGIISSAEIRDDIYKQGRGDKFLCIDITVPGFEWPKTLSLLLPVGSAKTWDNEGVYETNYNNPNVTYTESQVMTRRLQMIRDAFVNLGIPPEKQNDVDPQDLVGIEVVGTFKANKKGYVNVTKILVKKNEETVVEAAPSSAVSSLGW